MEAQKTARVELEDKVIEWGEVLETISNEIGAFVPGSRDLSITKTHIDNARAWLDSIYLRLGTDRVPQ